MSENAIPDKIKDIKAEIISLGFESSITGITEKQELIDLLKQARITGNTSSAAPTVSVKDYDVIKIPVVLIGEEHDSRKCSIEIAHKLRSLVDSMAPNEYFAVSEGEGLNDCYSMLRGKFTLDRIIVEESELNKKKAFSLFLLDTQIFIGIADGEINSGTGKEAHPSFPDSYKCDVNTFLGKGRFFLPILQAMPKGFEIYAKLVDAMFKKNIDLFYNFYEQILTFLINSDYLNELTNHNEFKELLNLFIRTKRYEFLRQITSILLGTRDSDIIKRVEERAVKEKASLKLIIIVFGARHYEHLKELITKSSVLSFDSRQSVTITEGGKKNTQKRSYKNVVIKNVVIKNVVIKNVVIKSKKIKIIIRK